MKPVIDSSQAMQRLRRHRQVAGGIVAIVLLGFAFQLWREHHLTQPDRTHAMTELTAKMKPLCIGRYLLDVPAQAEVALGNASSDSNKIERIPAYSSDAAYAHALQQREAELRNAKHETEGMLLKQVVKSSDGRQTVFVSRPEADDRRMYSVESFVHTPPVAWHITAESIDKYLRTDIDAILQIAQGLSYREPSTIPTTAGACIADGLLNRTPREVEEFHGGARIETLSWSISITSETSGPRDNLNFKDLFHRVDDAIDMAGPGSGIKKLRRAKVQVDGRSGQEYIGLYPEEGAIVLDAKLELYGNQKPQQPTIKLHMEAGWPVKKDPQDPRHFLSQDDALAVWDAIVKSIRPRPSAF